APARYRQSEFNSVLPIADRRSPAKMGRSRVCDAFVFPQGSARHSGVFHQYQRCRGLLNGLAGRWLAFAVAASLISLIPFALEGIDVRPWVLGARSYCLYLPLAFVIAGVFFSGTI